MLYFQQCHRRPSLEVEVRVRFFKGPYASVEELPCLTSPFNIPVFG